MNAARRRLCSATLVFEAVVLALFVPVAIKVSHVAPSAAAAIGGGLAVVCLVVCALLRYRLGYLVGSLVQLAMIATGVWAPVMYGLGVAFAALWATGIWLPTRYERDDSESALAASRSASRRR